MKVLELFAGTRSIGKAFQARGHEVFSVEWDKRFPEISLYKDILTLSAAEVLEKFGRPDVIWASPDCTTYSIAAISHHRQKDAGGGQLNPCFRLRQVLRPRKPSRPRAHNGPIPEPMVYRKPQGRHEKNGFYERAPQVHGYILPIRRRPNEADRYMDKPPRPQISPNVQKRRSLSYGGPTRGQDGNPGPQGERRAVDHSPGPV